MVPSRDIHGVAVPGMLYGTAWKEEKTRELTALALRAGFTGIDTANQRRHYVEAAVGEAVAAVMSEGGLTRDDLFLQTKFTSLAGQDHRLPYDPAAALAEQVEQSFESSLAHLGTTSVDSYLLHGPARVVGLDPSDWQIWRAMERLQLSGRARLIGISNVSLDQLEALCDGADVAPALVQNRCFARTGWDGEVRRFCARHGIGYQAFSLLTANARELMTPSVLHIAGARRVTLAQVVFRFAMQLGMIPLTGTSDPIHMAQDLACTELNLDEDELRILETVAG